MEFPQSFPNVKREKIKSSDRTRDDKPFETYVYAQLYSRTKGKYFKSRYTSTNTFHLTSKKTTFWYDSANKVLIFFENIRWRKNASIIV
jgi:hypothetical protein